ncbi:MAG: hypothetical protein M3P04_02525, partial [Actinomycetota bacterium]|nr:hypothetical protein [Actinomycetota bacterium]
SKLLRRPERFLSLDSSVFLDPEITSQEYCHRYGAQLIHDLPELLDAYGIEDTLGLQDSVDFEGDVVVVDEGLELLLDHSGTVLEYPFTLLELDDLVRELESEASES